MNIFAIDPGPTQSAWLLLMDGQIVCHGITNNEALLINVQDRALDGGVVIEMIASYGMAVGKEVFETCVWIGRFMQAAGGDVMRPTRKQIVINCCGSPKAKDSNVRQAMLDRWGAQGTKKEPGPTYGISKDVWSALAVATYALDHCKKGAA